MSATADRVFVLGAGRAGRGLARALGASGVDVVALHGRRAEPAESPESAQPGEPGALAVSAGRLPPSLGGATVVLVAVQDAALDAALEEILAAPPAPGAVLLQASGSAEPARFESARAAGFAAGTFHPLVPLADPRRAPALLRGSWVGVDGDARATRHPAGGASRRPTEPCGWPPIFRDSAHPQRSFGRG